METGKHLISYMHLVSLCMERRARCQATAVSNKVSRGN